MATTQRNEYTTATFLRVQNGITQQNTVRTDFFKRYFLKTIGANGSVVTLPGGNIFRKATAYTHWSKRLDLDSPQNTDYVVSALFNHGQYGIIRTSAGGYASDGILKGYLPTFKSSISSFPNFGSTGPQIPSGMRNEAVTKALLKIADSKAGLGEDIATFRQIAGMLHDPLSKLYKSLKACYDDKALRHLLHHSIRSIKQNGISGIAAQRYLEYVYGWKPLVSDIYGIVDMLKGQGGKTLLVSGRGVSRQQCNPTNSGFTDVSAKARTDITSADERAKVTCHLWGRIDPNSAGLRALNQLGLLNPASLAWELVPWSFVVDWFVPIGPVLQALTAPAGLIFVDGSVSVKTELTAQFEHHFTTFDSDSVSNSFATGQAIGVGYKRETLSTWPLPGFYLNQTPFSGDRPLKALALAIVGLRNLRI